MLAELEESRARLRWTPQLVDLWLDRYPDLVVVATTGTVHSLVFSDEAPGGGGDPHRLIDIKADLDRALLQLHQLNEDPLAANWLWESYIRGKSTADIADDEMCSQSWVQKVCRRGRNRLAEILGWYQLASGEEE